MINESESYIKLLLRFISATLSFVFKPLHLNLVLHDFVDSVVQTSRCCYCVKAEFILSCWFFHLNLTKPLAQYFLIYIFYRVLVFLGSVFVFDHLNNNFTNSAINISGLSHFYLLFVLLLCLKGM